MNIKRAFVGYCVDKGLKISVCGNLWILLAQRSSSCISWVSKRLFTSSVRILIQTNEGVLWHINFAADLNTLVEASILYLLQTSQRKLSGNIRDSQNVCRNVFSRTTVASCSRAYKLTVTIRECNTQAVNLKLAGICHRISGRCAKSLISSGKPCIQLFQIHGIVHRIHASSMLDRLKLLRNIATYALGIAILGYKLWICCLKLLKLNKQSVKLSVSELWIIKGIVGICRMVQDSIKLRCASGIFWRKCCHNYSKHKNVGARNLAPTRYLFASS